MCYLQIIIIIIVIIIIIIIIYCYLVTQCSPNSKEKLENAMNYSGTMCNLLKHRLWLELIQWVELLELLSAKKCFIFCENSVRPSSETFVYLFSLLVPQKVDRKK